MIWWADWYNSWCIASVGHGRVLPFASGGVRDDEVPHVQEAGSVERERLPTLLQ